MHRNYLKKRKLKKAYMNEIADELYRDEFKNTENLKDYETEDYGDEYDEEYDEQDGDENDEDE